MRPWPLVLLLIACAAPVVAVALVRRQTAAAPPGGAPAPLPTSPGGGLVFRDREVVLRPRLLQDAYSVVMPYANAGDRPLAIAGAVTSCGCAGIDFRPRELAPGAWGEAVVTVAGKGRFGVIEAAVQVRHDRGEPAPFAIRLELPPVPTLADELVIPAGAAEGVAPISGGAPGHRLRVLAGPASSRPGIAARIVADGEALRLVCAPTGERPAAARVTLRLGYDEQHAVERTVRVLAE